MKNIKKDKNSIDVFGYTVYNTDYRQLIGDYKNAIRDGRKLTVTYYNAAVLNNVYNSDEYAGLYGKFSIVHPDGVGLYMASKFLYGEKGLKKWFAGSDFFPLLEEAASDNGWKIFFFGDTNETIKLLMSVEKEYPVAGAVNGFDYNIEEVINQVNRSGADILLVGMGAPKQEKVIIEIAEKVNTPVIMAIGEGIKVFAGNKVRGPVFMRKTGLEWLARLLAHPTKFFHRYVIGIPLFLCRIIRFKWKLK